MGGTVGPLNDLTSEIYIWCIGRNVTTLVWYDTIHFSPFCLLCRILDKISRDQTPLCLLIAPSLESPTMVSTVAMNGDCKPNQITRVLSSVPTTTTGSKLAPGRQKLPTLSQTHGDHVQNCNMSRHGNAGVVDNKLIHCLPLMQSLFDMYFIIIHRIPIIFRSFI